MGEPTRDKDFESFMDESVRDSIKRKDCTRVGWHISDLIYCPKKAFYTNTTTGVPDNLDHKGAYIMFTGRLVEDTLRLLGFRNQVRLKHGDITGTLDWLDDERVVEFKTTRIKAGGITVDNVLERSAHWCDQLKSYCAMANRAKGSLVIMHMMGDYNPPITQVRVFTFEFMEKERLAWLKELETRRAMLETAIKTSTSDILEGPYFRWECGYCKFKDMCTEAVI